MEQGVIAIIAFFSFVGLVVVVVNCISCYRNSLQIKKHSNKITPFKSRR